MNAQELIDTARMLVARDKGLLAMDESNPIMEPNAEQPKTPASKPGSKPNGKDDLKSLPMPELQEKLGPSPDGPQSRRGAETPDPIWA